MYQKHEMDITLFGEKDVFAGVDHSGDVEFVESFNPSYADK